MLKSTLYLYYCAIINNLKGLIIGNTIGMKTIQLRNYINDSNIDQSANDLYMDLISNLNQQTKVLLVIDNDTSLTSSFLNSSIGQFLDNYGLITFKNLISFKGSRQQYNRIVDYINSYNKIYLTP